LCLGSSKHIPIAPTRQKKERRGGEVLVGARNSYWRRATRFEGPADRGVEGWEKILIRDSEWKERESQNLIYSPFVGLSLFLSQMQDFCTDTLLL
jgi:hypothetical protein